MEIQFADFFFKIIKKDLGQLLESFQFMHLASKEILKKLMNAASFIYYIFK